MINKLKGRLRKVKDRCMMPLEFYKDYRHYRKWNYNNLRNNDLCAYEARILRQAHVIEKGLSLSSPRKGFGTARIDELLEMLHGFIEKGYATDNFAFKNAVAVLNEYVEYQSTLDYQNDKLNKELISLNELAGQAINAGIEKTSYKQLRNLIDGSYPEFFNSRHSMRQFSTRDIDIEDIKKAVKLARKAPTACNRQASRVYFYEDDATNSKLGEYIAGNTGFDSEVKKYLVITADASAFYDTFERNQLYVEAGIFSMALVEALHYYGIGSCILQNGEKSKTNKRFREICDNIPQSERIVLFIAIGYYKDEFTYATSSRKAVDKVLICR